MIHAPPGGLMERDLPLFRKRREISSQQANVSTYIIADYARNKILAALQF